MLAITGNSSGLFIILVGRQVWPTALHPLTSTDIGATVDSKDGGAMLGMDIGTPFWLLQKP